MGVKSFNEILNAIDAGQSRIYTFRKAPTQTTAQGIWFDLSMSPGNPVPNYYAAAPGNWKSLTFSEGEVAPRGGDGGLFHGANVGSSYTKYLKSLMISGSAVTTTTPLSMILCDYVGYYPFIEMDGTTTLGATTLTRYTTGAGLQIMPVEVAAQATGGATFYCTYTNQSGVTGRTTATAICNTQTSTGTIINSQATPTAGFPSGPFMTLQAGDTGVRAIESVVFTGTDIGLVTFVLVQPLATVALDAIASTIYSPMERDFAAMNAFDMPVIVDDAYLNFICLPTGTLSGGQIYGTIETIWSAN